jgi:hypothetical protein
MLNIKAGDVVLVAKSLEKPKFTCAKVEFIDGEDIGAVDVENMHIAQLRKGFDTKAENVVAILDPTHPSYHNKYPALFDMRITHDDVGSLNLFYRPSGEVVRNLSNAFTAAYAALKSKGLDFIVQPQTCVWEIYPYDGGKYAGMYKRNSKPEKNPHRLSIMPEHTSYDHSWYSYVILHELAHHMHSEFVVGRQLNAKWIDLYSTSVPARDILKADTDRLLKALLEGEDLPSAFKGQLEEADEEAYKLILKAIKQQHKLGVKELDVLFVAEFNDQIKALWPETVVANDLNPLVTEYATKSYRELFAEAFAYYMTGRELPQEVKELVEESIAYAKSVSGDA